MGEEARSQETEAVKSYGGFGTFEPLGPKFGRKFKLTPHQRDQVHTMLKDGQSIRAIARHFNVGVATIDRIKRTMTLS